MFNILFLLFVSFMAIYINVWFLLMSPDVKARMGEKRKAKRTPAISILIPAHNEATTVAKTLKSLLGLDYPKDKLEVIVIENGSTDNTLNVVRRFVKSVSGLKIRVLSMPESGKAKALNLGLKHAKGELIGVLDADTFVTRTCLKRMVGYFDDSCVGAVTNHVKIVKPHRLIPSLQDIEYIFSAFSKKLISLLDALYVVPGTLSLMRRDLVNKVGFSQDTLTEDMDVAICILKENYKIVNALDAVSYTDVPKSLKGLLKQRIRWYRGFMQNFRKHSDVIFNRKFPHLGYFVLPFASLLAIFIGSFLTLVLIFDIIRSVTLFVKGVAYIPILEKLSLDLGALSITNFIISPYSTISYAIILIETFIILVISFRALKVESKKKFIFLPIYFFMYYCLIMVFWIISAFMELLGRRKRW